MHNCALDPTTRADEWENHMRSAAMFMAGLVIGLAVRSGSAQMPDIVRLNHVAIAVNMPHEGGREWIRSDEKY